MKNLLFIFLATGVVLMTACQTKQAFEMNEQGFQKFVDQLVGQLAPFENQRNLAEWNAYITGKDEYFATSNKYSLKIDSLFQSSADFEYLKALKENGTIKDELLIRQLDLLYLGFLRNQGDPELNKQITEMTSDVSKKMINFRAQLDGEEYTDNQITEILKNETDNKKRENAWRAQKQVGKLIATDLKKLVQLRNKKAQGLGYSDFYQMSLTLSEQKPADVEQVFTELAELTDGPFKEISDQLNSIFAKRYSITPDAIRPWHYEDLFAQETPAIYEIDLDRYFKNSDIPQLAEKYFFSFGMNVKTIIADSDLYEKEGKHQHAFSFCMDRGQDIRMLLNIVPNQRWMDTMLHELGHAVYDKYINMELPYLLRTAAHAFTTEGTAMLFGGMASNPDWMGQALRIQKHKLKRVRSTVEKSSRLSKMVFARWSLVMKFFEQQMYANPEQDLNELWWSLVERYQYIRRPENTNGGEWAAKMHISGYPAYYHNYLLGELFAAQVKNSIAIQLGDDVALSSVTFWDNPQAGEFMKEKIFAPGSRWYWNELLQKATGEELTAKYFVEEYIK